MYSFKALLLSVLVLTGLNFRSDRTSSTKWVLSRECFLKVNGSTNINKFGCLIANYNKADTLTFYKQNTGGPIKISGRLALDVEAFDCHNSMMTKDLRKTLKYKEFPRLIIRFVNLSRYPDVNDKGNTVIGEVTIELAGITKSFQVDYKFTTNGSNELTLVGTRQVNFSDFNLIPPRKLGGMIKTNNELLVEFDLKMKIIE